MQNINNIEELREAIHMLEAEQVEKWQLLREQFLVTYQSLKPVNILKNTFKDIVSSPFLIENVVANVVGMATGYLSKKIVVGFSGNIFKKLIGSVLQFGVKNTVAQHPDTIKSIGQYILQRFLQKKEMNTEKS